jgi:DNA invertase Pin-like site-specific DNA recombinase
MNPSECIQDNHRSRLAIIYIRQSTPHQAVYHQESLQLQYRLTERARACGWTPDRVRVLDADLGRSGRTTDGRPGFHELITLVTLEQVGILFAYDVTRLARNCTDWYQLLDLCGYRHCLVGDQDGVYDPATPNGRLILGLKGLISELELHTIRRRLTDGLLQKARRGELSQRLPAGLERDPLKQVVKHPDQEVQGRLALVFDTFLRLGAMSRVVHFFNQHDLRVPRRDCFGEVVWRPATTQAIYGILQNPAYAGAFVRGRKRWVSVAGKRVVRRTPVPQWPICVRDKYPAYITWDTFEKIQAMLHDNHSDYQSKHSRGVPRSGKGLLAGILYCGECGHKMNVHYRSGVYYACHFLRNKYQVGPGCQRVTAGPVDRHVACAFLEALAPAELDGYARALALGQQEAAQVRKAQQQQVDRLRYQAQLAERQFNRADPDNRLVAAELERRWEMTLRELRAAEEAWQREAPSPDPVPALDPETRQAVAEAGVRITQMWEENRLSLARQKALLRCLVDKVVVQRLTADTVQIRIVWKGGDTSTAAVSVPTASWSGLSGAKEIEAAIVRMASQGKSDREIARELTRQGGRSPRTSGVSAHMVLRIRLRQRVLRDRRQSATRCFPGYLTVAQLASRLGVSPFSIYARIASGKIEIAKHAEWKRYLFPDVPRTITMVQQLLAGKIQ